MIMLPSRPSVAPSGGTTEVVDRAPSTASPSPSIARVALNRAFVQVETRLLIWLF